MKVAVRPSTQADRDEASRVLASSYAALLQDWYTPELLAVALPKMTTAQDALLTSGTWYLAELDGQVAGVGGWTWERPGTGELEPELGHLRHFGTDPTFARRGVARALIERCFQDGAAAGVKRWECYSTLAAERFYAAFSFRSVAAFDVQMGGGVVFPSVRMIRTA